MTRKQKNTLISYFLYYGGFILIVFSITYILIYTLIFENFKGDLIHLLMSILAVVGIFNLQIAGDYNLYFYFVMSHPNYTLKKALRLDSDRGFIQGVPLNEFSEYNFMYNFNESNLVLTKINGIYYGEYNSKKIKLDMRGWILKDRYVYEFFHTYFRIQYIKKEKLAYKYIYTLIEDEKIKQITLIIINGNKKKKYFLTNNFMIKSSFSLKIKNYKKSRFIDSDKLSIDDFYSLNKKNDERN